MVMEKKMKNEKLVRRVPRVQTSFKGQRVLTQQHHKDDCDINVIVRRAGKNGGIELMKMHRENYADMTVAPESYQDALNIVVKAEEAFAELPALVRDRFSNDPSKYLNFINDKNNNEEMVKLGLATKRDEIPHHKPQDPPRAKPEKRSGAPVPDPAPEE